MSGKQKIKRVLLFGAALSSLIAVWAVLWLHGAFLPRWIVWEERSLTADNSCTITLKSGNVKAAYQGKEIWTSPKGIKVQDIVSSDIDRDGQEELILLCWKIGRYGPKRPFWVEKDERKWSQHIFVYGYQGETFHAEWGSSYIGQSVKSICVKTNASRQELLLLTDPDNQISGWIWDNWGFTRCNIDVDFILFGDNLIHEPIYRYALQQNDGNFGFLFEGMRSKIEESDIAVINQETPFVDEPARYSDYPRFGTPLGVGEAIAEAGFDIVTCATNHALDQGLDGIEMTKDFFDSQNILCLGIQGAQEREGCSCHMIVRNSIRFALFNYTYGTNGIPLPDFAPDMVQLLKDEDKIRADLKNARKEADFVIVFAHWGTEYAAEPDESQQKWSKVFLDCGVDAVVGTHPHVLQPYEVLTDENGHEMLVFYSIGNYVSAQADEAAVKGGMASFTVSLTPDGACITNYALEPLTIVGWKDGKFTVEER